MESRARLAMSGAAVFAASVAVVGSVAITNAAALADAPGVSIDAAPLSVPAAARSAAPSADRQPTAAPTPTATAVAEDTTTTVTVPAPAPVVVAPSTSRPADGTPSQTVQNQVASEVVASGSWDAAYAWAAEHGYSQEQVDRWIAALKVKVAKLRSDSRYEGDSKNSQRSQTPVPTGNPSAPAAITPGDGSKKDRSGDGTPDRPDR